MFQVICSAYVLVDRHIYALDRFDPIRIRFIFNVLFFSRSTHGRLHLHRHRID